jgi:hypothetical protein
MEPILDNDNTWQKFPELPIGMNGGIDDFAIIDDYVLLTGNTLSCTIPTITFRRRFGKPTKDAHLSLLTPEYDQIHSINTRVIANNGEFIAIGSNPDKLIVQSSTDCLKWNTLYTSDIEGISTVNTKIKILAGTYFVPCKGLFFFSTSNTNWLYTKLSDEYSSYDMIDVAYFNDVFYFLLIQDDKFAIAYTSDGVNMLYYNLTLPFVPKAISSNDTHVVIVGGKNNSCYLMHSKTGNVNDWTTLELTPDEHDTKHVRSFTDLVYTDKWTIVGYSSRWNSINTRLISEKGLIYNINKELTKFINIDNPSTDLKRVYVYGDSIYAIGHGFPNVDDFILKSIK